MNTAVVIRGRYARRQFIPDGPLPEGEGTAELILTSAPLRGQIPLERVESLRELLDRVTEENRHGEEETGPAVGNEAW